MWFGWLSHQRWPFMQITPHALGTYRHLTPSVVNRRWRDMAYSNHRLTAIRTVCSYCLKVVCRPQAVISARALAVAATILAASRGGGVFFVFFWWLMIATKKKQKSANTPPTTSYAETTGLPCRGRRAPREWARAVSSEPNLLLIILINSYRWDVLKVRAIHIRGILLVLI